MPLFIGLILGIIIIYSVGGWCGAIIGLIVLFGAVGATDSWHNTELYQKLEDKIEKIFYLND